MKCELCGQRVGVYNGEEETSHYFPLVEEMLAVALDGLEQLKWQGSEADQWAFTNKARETLVRIKAMEMRRRHGRSLDE